MKKLLFILSFFILGINANSQQKRTENLQKFDRKPVHFGFTFGFNVMDFDIHLSDEFMSLNEVFSVQNYPQFGFHLGPVSNFRLGENLELRALFNLSFGQRNMEYLTVKDPTVTAFEYDLVLMKIASTYMEFPVLLKYRSTRLGNYRPFVLAGVNPKFDLAARKEIKEEEKPKIKLNPFDLTYELGFGIDFYFDFFKLTTELKYNHGTRNLINPDGTQYAEAIDRMYSKMILFSIHLE